MVESQSALYARLTVALEELAGQLAGSPEAWLLGGSCGLWLQGVPLESPPRDIDIYADTEEAHSLHERLSSLATDKPAYDRNERYASVLSHYRLGDLEVEMAGGFEIRTARASYRTEVNELLAGASHQVALQKAVIQVMPLAHEFIFNLLRERHDRYLPIAAVMRKEPERHLPLLLELLKRNAWTSDLIGRMAELLDRPLLSQPWQEYHGWEE
ncbi:nucleotidyltransferase family protein [Paenibacillus senegalimassiliensis]|uniref:hypothetical protein n=1 Tax=Paenibacillus senegalimassiliensis TaxID=1737426 RepID=UPI00073E7E5C|nr:hypothetical protein [Paenibacillus senegalimassiliensis]